MEVIKWLVNVLIELILLPIYLLAGLLGFIFPLSKLNSKVTQKYPIVFVHGWFTGNPLYFFLKRYLEEKGFLVYMTDFGLLGRDFYQDADKLQKYVDERNLDSVILVGVSGGGIVSYLYLQKLNGWKKVHRFISIGTPLQGSPLACLATWFSGSARQMLLNSTFVHDINKETVLNPNKIVSISMKYDELVPKKSSSIPGVKKEIINGFGHVFLQALSRLSYRIIAEYAKD